MSHSFFHLKPKSKGNRKKEFFLWPKCLDSFLWKLLGEKRGPETLGDVCERERVCVCEREREKGERCIEGEKSQLLSLVKPIFFFW